MDKIKFYGTRGSCSLTSEKYMQFGGGTTCILFNFDKTHIMVDCGSGINDAIDDLKQIDELHLLISHGHLDHISGITSLLSAFEGKPLHIYGKSFDGVSVKEVIDNVMSKSLWPVRADTYKNIVFHEIVGDLKINDLIVENMDSNHPGGCSLFRLNYGKESIVTAFDFCHLGGYDAKLIDFANGCTTLIYDGCFSEKELGEKPTWGHSTPEAGARIGKEIGCEKVYITHFGIYDDETLSEWEKVSKSIYKNVEFARAGSKNNKLEKVVEIGTLLSSEKDNDVLLLKVVETSMDITNADGGTLYLLNDGKLDFKVLINRSKETCLISKDSHLDIPSVDINGKNVCAAAARERKLINIADCYNDKDYDFSGAKKYDEMNTYLTKSVLVIPLIDEYDEIVGVLQLINSIDKKGEIIPFKKDDEKTLSALANQASMAIMNSSYSQKINDLLYGFIKVMSVGIDERTPYNVNHTKNMVNFAEKFFQYENANNGKYKVDYNKSREILMSIWLHDIGKILTPLDIMNKDSRLGDAINEVENRFKRRDLLLRLQFAQKSISELEYQALEKERVDQLVFVKLVNKAGFLNDELKNQLDELSKKTYIELDGSEVPILTSEEIYQLNILKGTLNREERNIMEGHVSMTQKFLSQLKFPKHYSNIPVYAGNHHEFLDGTGYPNHLTEKDLPWPCRLITILDIFEALTAKDRPYKKPFTAEKALEILDDMANNGKLDKEIISEFKNAESWKE